MGVREKARAIVRGLCAHFEGLRLRPYFDSVRVATIGIGSTFYEDGQKVKITDPPITEDRAYGLLDLTLDRVYMPGTLKLCPRCSADANLWAALSDFSYNLGLTRLAGSTLRRKIRVGDMVGARKEIVKWCHAGGRKLPGLVRRRAAEAALIG